MNKPSRPLLVGPLLQSFFSEHLCSHKDASIQTIASYRDTFRLLLSYVQQTAGIEPSALRIADLEVTVILSRTPRAATAQFSPFPEYPVGSNPFLLPVGSSSRPRQRGLGHPSFGYPDKAL
jgi:hypothetical protein